MKNKIIKSIIIGIFIGIDIGLFMSIIFSIIVADGAYYPAPPRFMQHFSNEVTAMIASILIWAAIGILFSATSLIYRETDFSITKMTALHCIINYVFFVPLSVLAGWYSFNIADIASFTIIYIIVYIIVWGIFMFINLKHVREINARLKNDVR